MNLKKRILAFIHLGKQLMLLQENRTAGKQLLKFKDVVQQASVANDWFTAENVYFAIDALAKSLSAENINKWLLNYPRLESYETNKSVALIMAGNIPLVGFHDLLCTLISGHRAIVKLSSKDDILLKGIIELLLNIEPKFKDTVFFTDEHLKNFDAVIATGSTNSARYFEYYFGKYPNIIRKNRNSVAVLTGNETEEELIRLADDIFLYFGLGCRNVSKLFIPDDFDVDRFFKAAYKYKDLINHNKYANNYTYNRSVYLMNKIDFLENGFSILKEDLAMSSPISVVFYERYRKLKTVKQRLKQDEEQIQCVASSQKDLPNRVAFGEAQNPQLWDYADNVDTMKFLLNL